MKGANTYVQDTKYQESAGLCECGFPFEALKHDPPLTRAYSYGAYILFCNRCKTVRPNIRRWGEWERELS